MFLEARQSLFIRTKPFSFGKGTPIATRETGFREGRQGFGTKERDGKSWRVGVYISAWAFFMSPHLSKAPL